MCHHLSAIEHLRFQPGLLRQSGAVGSVLPDRLPDCLDLHPCRMLDQILPRHAPSLCLHSLSTHAGCHPHTALKASHLHPSPQASVRPPAALGSRPGTVCEEPASGFWLLHTQPTSNLGRFDGNQESCHLVTPEVGTPELSSPQPVCCLVPSRNPLL